METILGYMSSDVENQDPIMPVRQILEIIKSFINFSPESSASDPNLIVILAGYSVSGSNPIECFPDVARLTSIRPDFSVIKRISPILSGINA